MTTITDKVTQYLDHLNVFQDTNGKLLKNTYLVIEFLQLATMVRDDMLGFDNVLPTRKIAKRFGKEPEEIEFSLDALKYLILHIAKTNSTTP